MGRKYLMIGNHLGEEQVNWWKAFGGGKNYGRKSFGEELVNWWKAFGGGKNYGMKSFGEERI